MADNVEITAGTGTAIATDEIQVSGTGALSHVQFVKIVDGTLNGTGAIGGDAANGLDVDVTRLPALAAGTNNIGDVDVLTLPALPAGTNNIGDVDVLTVPAPLSTTGTGTEATALRVTIATDSTGLVSIDDNGGSLTVDAPVGTPAFVRLSDGAAAITTLPVSLASVPSHAVTNAGTFATQTTLATLTTGGASAKNSTSSDGGTALTSTAQVISAAAGTLYGWYIYNPNSSAQFVQFYNTAQASVTVGTTNPLFMLTIPAASAANVALSIGIAFSNVGWSWAATSTAGGNGAPVSSLDAVCWYA